jgi:photosystem II stability/assembly factor-like uncharacterized protein
MARLILVGTRKGLFLIRENGTSWSVEGPQLTGWEVFHGMRDPRDGTFYAATNNWVYGASVHRSVDGETWDRAEEIGLPEDSGLTLEKAWHVEPGHASEPETLFLGAAPGVLMRSDDAGATWSPVKGILEHPTREAWQPGAGGMCCHSIQIDPEDAGHMVIAISAAGAFRSEDGGETWAPANQGVAADFLPGEEPHEIGQCVHKLLLHPGRPGRLWQQNHCGVYRSDDWGATWSRLDRNGLPSDFGFPIALDPADPDRAWVVPEEGAENRVTADNRFGVYRTDDGGASWELETDGLPQQAWLAVLREATSYDDQGVYVGTQSGGVWARGGDGRWTEIARDLPPVLSVEAAAA